MKAKRKIIEIDEEKCTGCGQCVSACAEGAIELVHGKAKLISENYCDGLAACLGECPEGALRIVEKEAAVFDAEAVEHHLSGLRTPQSEPSLTTLPCGCPSTNLQMFSTPCEAANQPVAQNSATPTLTHWPVQIRLIPPTAPFLKKGHLLVAADCTPVAYPDFHKDFLAGRSIMVGCPKFDDADEYIHKFADIFSVADVQSITVLIMEVPCCSKLPVIVREGMVMAGKHIPMEVAVVSARGKILKREKLAA